MGVLKILEEIITDSPDKELRISDQQKRIDNAKRRLIDASGSSINVAVKTPGEFFQSGFDTQIARRLKSEPKLKFGLVFNTAETPEEAGEQIKEFAPAISKFIEMGGGENRVQLFWSPKELSNVFVVSDGKRVFIQNDEEQKVFFSPKNKKLGDICERKFVEFTKHSTPIPNVPDPSGESDVN